MTRIWTGTASVVNGDATVVLTGDPLSDANCPADATIALDGASYFVLSRTDTTTIELTRGYAGTTSASVAAEIDPLNPAALSVVNAALLAARVQAQLNILDKNSQGLFYTLIGATGDADPTPGKFAFDDDDPAAAAEFYVDNIDGNNRSVVGLLAQWSAGTVLVIRSLTTTAYIAIRMSSDNAAQSGYFKGQFARVGHDGVIAPGEQMSAGWFRVGEGLAFDISGSFAERGDYDDQAAGFVYLSNDGDGEDLTGGVLFVKNSATDGDWQAGIPLQGAKGFAGWAPTFALANDGARRVLQLTGYVGGEGAAPTADIGKYVSASGYTSTIASAMDIRGAAGTNGTSPTIAVGTVTPLASGATPTVANGGTSSAAVFNFGLPVPNDGTDGDNGADGTDPGVLLIWDDGNTLGDPGSGKIRASDDALGSATWLAISKTNRAGDDISGFLATLDDSSNPSRKGVATLTRSGGNAQATVDITGITDHTGYVEVAVTTPSGAAGFLNNNLISFQFAPAGDQGVSGAGTGDVIGPGSSTDGRIAVYDGATGKLLKDGGSAVADLVLKANNGSDFASKQATFDNLSLDGADIASGGTVNLETATGSFVAITGTTATTAITLSDGHRRRTLAAAGWPITVGASLVLNNGGSSYTCSAGDIIDWVADGTVVRGTVHPISGVMPGVNAAIAAYVAAQDVEVFKGAIDCSTNPNYPAADAGHVYRVSVAGKIGGASGINVEVNDRLECVVDSTASGNQATVGANWMISQANIDGAVTGQTSAVDGELALFSGTSGKVLKRATQTGLLSAASGVLGAVTIGTGLSFSGGTLSATGSGMTDQQRQNALLNMANLSKALGSSLRVLETFADGYKASDGINAGASSNVDTSHTAASGYVGATQGGTTVQINGFDSDLSKGSNFTFVDRTTAVSNSVVVFKIGIYNTSAGRTFVAKILKRNSSTNFDVVASQSFVHPGGGWADVTLTSPYTVPGTGAYYLGAYTVAGTYSATVATNARSYISSEATGSGVTGWTEDSNGTNEPMRYTHTPIANNITLVTTTQTADASVSNARALLEIDPIDSITLGTDLTAEVTCDGGSHWASTTLSSVGKGQAGRTVVESADTACTAGTSFAARIKTLNNKSVNVYKTTVTVR
jgi:hypothetical protein